MTYRLVPLSMTLLIANPKFKDMPLFDVEYLGNDTK